MPPATRRPAFWRTAGFRATLYQVLVIALLVGRSPG